MRLCATFAAEAAAAAPAAVSSTPGGGADSEWDQRRAAPRAAAGSASAACGSRGSAPSHAPSCCGILVRTVQTFAPAPPPSAVASLWGQRLRHHYGARFDARDALAEWDHGAAVVPVAGIVHRKQFV